ncbi:tyrosine-type recombinase/integrase [Cyanothece sp. BG0011]|uniref:tyrosine-type recombinase/integrase n=1 Tax=Cyanothece sp. BG0011 TaxID=2082950 RepID=UPI000D1F561B|nr:tyrosine-type recombinase/integrase [Cyanothece sp. BG0011]
MPWKKVEIEGHDYQGQCTLGVQREKLIIVFSRTLFGGKQKTLSLNLSDTPANRTIAFNKLRAIQNDIDLGRFDATLEQYKPQVKQKDYLQLVSDLYPDISLLSLWEKYFEYKRLSLKETTIHYLKTSVENYLKKSGIKSPYEALELREWLITHTTQSMAKRVLTHINAAFKWGLKHKLVKGLNPYEGMANELVHNYQVETKPNAFTPKEKEAVINAFLNHKGNWNKRGYTGYSYRHYANFVKFLFFTGCRPNEAIGLRWGDISTDFKKITFDGGIYQLTNGKAVRTKHSKNNRKREFPCNLELQEILSSIKPKEVNEDDLIFLSPKGKNINYGNFSSNAWKRLVDPIKPNTTPYCCRDTFITEQIAKGVNPAIVAKWCDSSTATIEKHYFDSLNISHILPQ